MQISKNGDLLCAQVNIPVEQVPACTRAITVAMQAAALHTADGLTADAVYWLAEIMNQLQLSGTQANHVENCARKGEFPHQ